MLWYQKDAPQIVRGRLRKAVEGTPILVRDSLPDGWQAKTSSPVITVQSDGSRGGAGYDVEVIRITVHAVDKVTARRLLTAVDSAMTTPLALGIFFSSRPAGGLMVYNNSKNGGGAAASSLYSVTNNREKKHG